MHIVHLSSELASVCKVGGLGDVVYSLSQEMQKQGHDVEIIMPKYDCFDFSKVSHLSASFREIDSYDGSDVIKNTIWTCEYNGLKLFLIEPHHPSYFFSRGKIYGCADDVDRFLYFTRTAMEFLYKSGKTPDCIHLHDWPVAIGASLLEDMYKPLGFQPGGTLLTIHSMEHQGKCSHSQLEKIGLHPLEHIEKYQDPTTSTAMNILKAGIEDSTLITTVSPTYAKEVMTKSGGWGLDQTLLTHKMKFKGILNGVDTSYWNPKNDPYLIHHYDTHPGEAEVRLKKIKEAKSLNKQILRNSLNLGDSTGPLIGCVTRLVNQKGPDLIAQAVETSMDLNAQFILLGSEYTEEVKHTFISLKERFAGKKNFALYLHRNEKLAHQIFAGSDMIIVPSIYEPCGLTQMIALRYGSIPVVRGTGGLIDTVFDIQHSGMEQEKKNGFVFHEASREATDACLRRAIALYEQSPKQWGELIRTAMQADYSWKQSIQKYISLYVHLKHRKNMSA